MEKEQWQKPEVTEFDIAELTENLQLTGGDIQTGLGDDQPPGS